MPRFFIAFALLIVPASVAAQETFTPLDAGLRVGEKIHVLVDGPCAAENCSGELVKGRITELSAASVVLNEGSDRRPVAVADVRYVERPPDRPWNGVLAGFGVGFGAGFVAARADCGSGCIFDSAGAAAAVGLIFGGIGAGIGAISDALISRPQVVFVRASTRTRRATVMPIVHTKGGGISVSIGF